LNEEYLKLAEKDMSAFGVKLAHKGNEATVTMHPQVGGEDIRDVLSEGEQTMHALALFFAELETCSHCVLVFDDPISSFDYNYSENFCDRLASFCQQHPHRQMIILTHSWDCFMQFQASVRRIDPAPNVSVKVMEGCRQLAEYNERFDAVKKEIEVELAMSGEPSKAQKESLAGKMRRLIEIIVNTFVFSGQRYQYKQKYPTVSTFELFTKVTPLTKGEANTLKELFARLSHKEHDDPMNDYTNTDKAMFRTRYNRILQVATDIQSRIP
jgi:wobble nucleotide-excising tRNase